MKGVVLWGTKNVFYVLPYEEYNCCIQNTDMKSIHSGDVIECRIKGKRQYAGDNVFTTFCTASDNVEYIITDQTATPMQGLITKLYERKNTIVRSKGSKQHLVTTNIDVLGVIASVDTPTFKPQFIDRILCIAVQQKIIPLLIVNKVDIWNIENVCKKKEIEKCRDLIRIYENIYDTVIYTSVLEKIGIKELMKYVKGKRCAFIGQSGVGKSSIVNILISCAKQKIGEISKKYNRGRHTTICPTVNIGKGFCIVDTPGIRDLSPANLTIRDIMLGYREFLEYSSLCKLTKCLHYKEPYCAVKEQVGKAIHKSRYRSYIQLLKEILGKEKWYHKKH